MYNIILHNFKLNLTNNLAMNALVRQLHEGHLQVDERSATFETTEVTSSYSDSFPRDKT
jgi:hypothetical protein